MSKRIALKDFIEVDHVDLSGFFRQIGFSSEHSQEDVSGFNATGTDEFLAGRTTQQVTGEVFGSYGSNEVHQVLYPLHRDKSTFYFRWRPDQSAVVSATNPELRGNAQLLTYSPGATRGEVDAFAVTFTAADETGFKFFAT
jgi:hypothetical protein